MQSFCPSCRQPVLKIATGTHPFFSHQVTSRLLREGTSLFKVRGPGGLSPLLRFEPPAVNEKVLFYAQNVSNSPPLSLRPLLDLATSTTWDVPSQIGLM